MKESRLVLSPREPLVERAADQFERQIQAALGDGHRHLIVDLGAVARIDDAGIRGLVRGYTTARRLGGSLRLAGANEDVRDFLHSAHLDTVFPVVDSVDAARVRDWSWRPIALMAGGIGFCVALFWAGQEPSGPALTNSSPLNDIGTGTAFAGGQPLLALVKLLVATGIGLLVTAVHRPALRDKPLSRSVVWRSPCPKPPFACGRTPTRP